MARHLFTSESVTEGHPDKICDNISDAVLDAMKAGTAELCLLSADASERLYKELVRASENLTQAHVPIYITDYTMDGFGMCLGAKKTAVLSVNDRGFAKRITEELTV